MPLPSTLQVDYPISGSSSVALRTGGLSHEQVTEKSGAENSGMLRSHEVPVSVSWDLVSRSLTAVDDYSCFPTVVWL